MGANLDQESIKESINVRCPSCFKLYSVQRQDMHEAKPKFECIGCHKRFWISRDEALRELGGVIGFPLEWVEEKSAAQDTKISTRAFQCPKCGAAYSGGDHECTSCGIIFEKFNEVKNRTRPEPAASRDLKFQWDQVLQQFDRWNEHQVFIQMAQAEASLDYAEHCYQQILAVNPSDEFAKKAASQIETLSTTLQSSLHGQQAESDTKLNLPKLRLGTMVMLLSVLVIIIGITVPGLRNLIGFGSAVLFAFMTLRFYFRAI